MLDNPPWVWYSFSMPTIGIFVLRKIFFSYGDYYNRTILRRCNNESKNYIGLQ